MVDGENRGGKVGDKQCKSYLKAEVKNLSKKGLKSFSFLVVGTLVEREKLQFKVEEFS